MIDDKPQKELIDEKSPQDFSSMDKHAIETLKEKYNLLKKEIAKVIVGQEKVVEQVLMAIFAQSHCLIVGVPGLAKTLLIKTLAQTLDLKFSRIQFTPDLMPADITGTIILQEDQVNRGQREAKFMPGPILQGNIILADEINRASPKTQSALLESMQEYQVTIAGDKHNVMMPFFVLATQNPIEQEGTYPLPEAQLDRFMFNIKIEYPTKDEELDIMNKTTGTEIPQVNKILSTEEILNIQKIVRKIPIGNAEIEYAINLIRKTRPHELDAHKEIKEYVSWGAGPRAGQFLIIGAKTVAALSGRIYVTTDDIKYVAPAVLRHRIILRSSFSSYITPDEIINRLIDDQKIDEKSSLLVAPIAKVLPSSRATNS